MKKWIVILILAIVGMGAVAWGLLTENVLINPLGDGSKKKINRTMKNIGFLPTWMVGKTMEYTNELDELIFLGIEVSEEGELIWDNNAKKIYNEDYLKIKNNTKKYGGKNVLGIKLFKDEKLKKFFGSEEAKENLITELKELVEKEKMDGINVDFEWQNDQFAVLDEDFVQYLKKIKSETGKEMSVDIFANTVIKGNGEKLMKLSEVVDRVIVMAYDFHRAGSVNAGPVAPVNGEVGERNIYEVIEKIVEVGLPKGKMVMAYPLYGYEWRTKTDELKSKALEYEGMWTINKLKIASASSLMENKDFAVNWDEVSMTPWMTYKDESEKTRIKYVKLKNGKYRKVTEKYMSEDIHEIYFENERSLKIKIDLAKNASLGGIGWWALGYEGDSGNLWNLLN